MDEGRRSFLKQTGTTALGLGCGLTALSAGCSSTGHGADDDSASSQWAMIIDVEKCKGPDLQKACADECHRVHNVPKITKEPGKPGKENQAIDWIWAESYEHTFPDQAHAHTSTAMKETPILVLCNHCNHPPCVRVCPTQATWKREPDGLVMMDMHRCIGCRYCMAACPYGSRSFNYCDPREYFRDENGELKLPADYPTRTIGVVEKCTFCAERIRDAGEGETPMPACVEVANRMQPGAMTFGRLGDAEIKQKLEENNTICRRVGLGTGPNVYYIV